MMKSDRRLHYIIQDAETVVYDQDSIVSCPTEEEAIEYIREQEKDQKYYLVVNNTLVEVSKKIYSEYYRMERRERYQIERDILKGTVFYDGFNLEDQSGAEMMRDPNQISVEDLVEITYMAELLLKQLCKLSDIEKILITNIYYQSKSIRMLSREWGIPETSLRRKHDNILRKLRKSLDS